MIYNLKSPTELSGFFVVYDGSTMLEAPGLRGVSHLLEHLMCKSFDHLQDELQSNGVTWNAYTSNHEVVFWMTGLETYLAPFRPKLLECLRKFEITEEQFQTERSIVLQEYNDHFADPFNAHWGNTLRNRFNYYQPIGHRADLEELTLERLRQYWQEWFSTPTKIISVSDRYQHFSSQKLARISSLDPLLLPNGHPLDNGGTRLEVTKPRPESAVLLLQTDPIRKDVPVLKIASFMLGDGLNSPLYKEIREKRGLCYRIWSYMTRFNDDHLFTIGSMIEDAKVYEAVAVISEILTNVDRYLTSERLEVVRKQLIIEDKMEAINRYTNVHPWLTPEQYQVRTIQESVTLEEVRQAVQHYLHPDNLLLSVDTRGYLVPKCG